MSDDNGSDDLTDHTAEQEHAQTSGRARMIGGALIAAATVLVIVLVIVSISDSITLPGSSSTDDLTVVQQAALLFADAAIKFEADNDGDPPQIGTKDWPDPKAGPVDSKGTPYIVTSELPKGDWVVTNLATVVVPAVVYELDGKGGFKITASDVTVKRATDQRSGETTETTKWNYCPVIIKGDETSIGDCKQQEQKNRTSPPDDAPPVRDPAAGPPERDRPPNQ